MAAPAWMSEALGQAGRTCRASAAISAKGASPLVWVNQLVTRRRQGRAALAAKFQAFGVVKSTARATHGCALQHGRASGWGALGQVP